MMMSVSCAKIAWKYWKLCKLSIVCGNDKQMVSTTVLLHTMYNMLSEMAVR